MYELVDDLRDVNRGATYSRTLVAMKVVQGQCMVGCQGDVAYAKSTLIGLGS